MTDERDPEASQLREAFDAFFAAHAAVLWSLPPAEEGWRFYQAGAAYGMGEERTKLAVAERNRRQSLADTARLRDDRDALTAENARLRAALTNLADVVEEFAEEDIADDLIPLIEARAALTRRADGEV